MRYAPALLLLDKRHSCAVRILPRSKAAIYGKECKRIHQRQNIPYVSLSSMACQAANRCNKQTRAPACLLSEDIMDDESTPFLSKGSD
eukprot:6179001-Pleurochrysis_carterae.AAC.6